VAAVRGSSTIRVMAEHPVEEPTPTFDAPGLRELAARQDGVVSRRQLRELHARDHDIVRLLRRRELVRVVDGVYVDHTGDLTWKQRAWVALLSAWPAALSHESALPKPPSRPIHVAVALGRKPTALPGVRFHRIADFDARVQWSRSQPRMRIEHAATDVAITKSRTDRQFKVFADVCQSRQTDAQHILDALATRKRVAGRDTLVELLQDLQSGACSVLERGWLGLERAHGLPVADRQRPVTAGGRRTYLDAPYPAYGVRVELDGRAFHDDAQSRDADAERDLDGQVESEDVTVRLTYGQVFGRGCLTAKRVATVLERRGWPGPFVPCPRCP
jgi:hypothetical protein